jgi:hypothetical protein
MKDCDASENGTTCRFQRIACVTAFAVAFMVSLPQLAHADQVTPPPVPVNIQVPAGNKAFLVGHAVGTQNYVCLPSVAGVKFTLFTPQATLFDDDGKQLTTHYFSPNAVEGSTIRATWQHSRDTSSVWGMARPGESSSDPYYVAPGAIAWLLLRRVGAQDGSMGGDTLSKATFIQRLNTSGGMAPATGCMSSTDIGNQAWCPTRPTTSSIQTAEGDAYLAIAVSSATTRRTSLGRTVSHYRTAARGYSRAMPRPECLRSRTTRAACAGQRFSISW